MFGKKHLIITAVITAAAVWGLACLYFVGLGGYSSADTLVRAKKIITEHYVDTLTEEQLRQMNDMAISAMVYSLEDPYSAYMNEELLADYQENQEEVYAGIGVSVSFDASTETMTVVSPYEDSPARRAGILPGDIITQVDDIVISAETYDAAVDYIKKGENEDMTLTLLRGSESLTVSVHREEVSRQSVTHKMLGGRIGYIYISEFLHNTTDDFAAALADLKSRDMAGLIIDLRDNPGGYAQTVLPITDSLLPEGVIAYLEDSQGNREYFHSDEEALSLPMAVLINGSSASASELLAGSLKAHGLATIVGEKSYGKAVGQRLFALNSRTALYLTNARYFTPNGECIDGEGITPDIEASLPEDFEGQISALEPEQDTQLARALEVLYQETEQ